MTDAAPSGLPTTLLPYRHGVVEYGVVDLPHRAVPATPTTTGSSVNSAPSVPSAPSVTSAVSTTPRTTLFLHGLAGSIEDARPLASGVPGRKVFAHLPGHGRSTAPAPLGYPALADAARAVADHVSATAALGISLGAATLLRILADTPARFDRVVLYLPAVADLPRAPEAAAPHRRLAAGLTAADPAEVRAALLLTQPLAVRDGALAGDWATRRAAELLAETAAGRDPARLLPLAAAVPLDSPAPLAAVRVPVLVIAQEGDPAHPVGTARRLAAALPNAELAVFDDRGALWGHRRELRDTIAPFLAG